MESLSKARLEIQNLLALLPRSSANDSLSFLADSDHPVRALLGSYEAYSAVSSALNGSGDDPLCQWLYDNFLHSSDDSEFDFRPVVMSLVPLIVGLYYSRVYSSPASIGSPSVAGFEAVLLALYSSEVKCRAGKPLLVSIPSLDYLSRHPSLYHTPTPQPQLTSKSPPTSLRSGAFAADCGIRVGIISPPLKPQIEIKSTERACIVGVAFHCFFKHIPQMPPWSKIELCRVTASWAVYDCLSAHSLDIHSTNQLDDDDGAAGMENILLRVESKLKINGNRTIHSQNSHSLSAGQRDGHEGVKIQLPWELLQPLLRNLSHCLLAPAPLCTQEVKDFASVAVRRLYARAYHDLCPQAILATRSLVRLDNRARTTAKAAALATFSDANTANSKKPGILLVSN